MSFDFGYFESQAKQKLQELKDNNLYRYFPLISNSIDFPYAFNHKTESEVVIWGNNNYLGLAQNKQLIEAKIGAAKMFGTGSGGTRNVLGTSQILNDLEEKVAEWHGKEQAIVHVSALDANIGVLSALGKIFKDVLFISDEENHASMIDGIKFSGAKKIVFEHNNIEHLASILDQQSLENPKVPIILVIESIYSMSGDKAPLEEIIALKEKYNFLLYLDEVHAVGVYGKNGSGYADTLKIANNVDIICGTFGKAFGCAGGYIVASEVLCEVLRHYSRSFIFSTSMQPDNVASVLKALEIISGEEGVEIRIKHREIVNKVKESLKENEINFLDFDTHIIPVIIGDEEKTTEIAKNLIENHKIAVTPLFYPTVPKGEARIRINPTPLHTEEMIENLVSALKQEIL